MASIVHKVVIQLPSLAEFSFGSLGGSSYSFGDLVHVFFRHGTGRSRLGGRGQLGRELGVPLIEPGRG